MWAVKVSAKAREDYAQETRLGAVPALCIPSCLASKDSCTCHVTTLSIFRTARAGNRRA